MQVRAHSPPHTAPPSRSMGKVTTVSVPQGKHRRHGTPQMQPPPQPRLETVNQASSLRTSRRCPACPHILSCGPPSKPSRACTQPSVRSDSVCHAVDVGPPQVPKAATVRASRTRRCCPWQARAAAPAATATLAAATTTHISIVTRLRSPGWSRLPPSPLRCCCRRRHPLCWSWPRNHHFTASHRGLLTATDPSRFLPLEKGTAVRRAVEKGTAVRRAVRYFHPRRPSRHRPSRRQQSLRLQQPPQRLW